ncbi:MAG TPA: beta-L-arabinofuranosidase domain-containing protein [Chthonomonadaceae bacterium]|nr:beta-L-arabinofuranosidase domain-containing protein [Chthonomonadaceae bacterium]
MKPRTAVSVLSLLLGVLLCYSPARAQQNPMGLALPATAQVTDTFSPLPFGAAQLQGGMLGTRFEASARHRLLEVDENDLLDCFERRNVPHQDWQGEHVGKYLHAAAQTWAITGDPQLRAKMDRIVARLLKTQEADGYLGTYKPEHRWTSWDVWVHKYDLLGLLTYYQATSNKSALAACRRIGDLLCKTFGTGPGQRDINKSGEHMGMAPDSVLEAVVLLYRATREPRYLAFAGYIVRNYDAPGGPAILASLEKYRSVRRVANGKAYEMTSNFNGLLELYRVTGDRRLLNDMLIGWDDIVRNRLYLTGSASSGEVFQDDFHLPNGERANICETCVTVTWEQMNLQLLRLTGEARFAEQAERAILNHLLGAQKPTGDDWAYYTPLEGHKPYDSATTCCHSSGPRGVALLPSFAIMTSNDGGLVVNFYNTGEATVLLPKAGRVKITQQTDYPLNGKVLLTLTPDKSGAKFPLRLRIPSFLTGLDYRINGAPQPLDYKPGAPNYLLIDRAWKRGDTVTLDLQLATRLVRGDHENAGRAALVRGPLVLALDTALNPDLPNIRRAELASEDLVGLKFTYAPERAKAGEWVFQTAGRIGGTALTIPLYLTPYATAGQDGKSRFEVWIPLPGKAPDAGRSGSVLANGIASASRQGNVEGEINDDDPDTFRVTFNGQRAEEDWYAVTLEKPAMIRRVVFIHGKRFHDGGWFDTSEGKPRIQVQTEKGGAWKTVGLLDTYPAATDVDPKGLRDGQRFEMTFPSIQVFGVRIVGKPACGDNSAQCFSSCAELQAFER